VVAGPPGTEQRVFEAYYALYAEARGKPRPFELQFVELSDGGVHEIADVRIESFRVPHQDRFLSLGHRLRAAKTSLVYSGDTAWTPALLQQSSGADLFLCECSSFVTEIPRHIRYRDIEQNRGRFECKRLLLTHLGREVRERSDEIGEQLANDGLTVELG
jgi:ribonuclease BN (tRNA processing enzyme)